MVHYVPNYDQGKNEPTFVPGWLESRGIHDKFGIGRSIYLPGPYPQTSPVLSVLTAPIVLHWCGIDVPYWLYCINWRVAMAELTRTWMTHWLTWREHRASSWSTSTAFHQTGGWWWRYSLCWWCSSWSSYSSSLDLLYHSARDALAAMRSILLFLLLLLCVHNFHPGW